MQTNVLLDLYLNLFEASHRSNRVDHRFHFLTLAAILAWKSGYEELARELCQRMREIDSNHPLACERPPERLFDANPPISTLWQDLNETYPFEKAEYLLERYRAGGYSGHHSFTIPESDEPTQEAQYFARKGLYPSRRTGRSPTSRRSRLISAGPPSSTRHRRSERPRRGHRSTEPARIHRFPLIDPPTLELTRRAATTRELPGSLLALLGLLLVFGLATALFLGPWNPLVR